MKTNSTMEETYNQMIDLQTNNLNNLKKSELFITKSEFDEVHIQLYYDNLNQIVFYTYKNYDYITNSFGDYKNNNVVIYLNNKLFDSSIVGFYNYFNLYYEYAEIVYDRLFSKVIKDVYNLDVLYISVSNYYKDLDFNIRNANKELGLKLKLKCNTYKPMIIIDVKKYKELIKEMSIKTWFKQNDSTEYTIPDMNPKTTFKQVYNKPQDSYELIGVYETVVREMVFDVLSFAYDVNYEEIYIRWESQFK